MIFRNFQGVLFGILITALVLTFAPVHADKLETKVKTKQADLQELLKILQPVNVRQADRASKGLFDDFFEQKDRLYYGAPKTGKQTPPALELNPPRNLHRTF